MYAPEYVSGELTEVVVAIYERPKQIPRASITVAYNLASAYMAHRLAVGVNNAFSIVAPTDLEDLFKSFADNCKIRFVATNDLTISNSGRESESEPLPTTFVLGPKSTEEAALKTDSMSVFSFHAKKDQLVAVIQQSRRKKGRERQFRLAAEIASQLFGDDDLNDALPNLIEMWPTASDTLEVGGAYKYTVARENWEHKNTTQVTITRNPREKGTVLSK